MLKLVLLRDRLETLTLLSEGNIFDKIIANLRRYEGRQAKVDAKTMQALRALFKIAKASHGDEFIGLWVAKMGKGKVTAEQAVAFFSSEEFRKWAQDKWDELGAKAKELVQAGVLDSADLGVWSMQKEIEIIGKYEGFSASGEVEGAAGWNRPGGTQGLYPERFYIDPRAHSVPQVEQILTLMATDFGNLTAEMVPAVTRTLIEGAQAGEDIKRLRKRLMDAYNMGQARADIIARWAMIRSFNQARLAQYEEAKVLLPGLKKVWMAHLDDRTCPHCFPAGTLVDGKPIEEIKPGDYVTTHMGRKRKVLEVSCRPYDGDMITIETPVGSVTCTANHEIYVYRGGDYLWVKAEDLKPTDHLVRIKGGG